jgi:hypothetical protein
MELEDRLSSDQSQNEIRMERDSVLENRNISLAAANMRNLMIPAQRHFIPR